MKEEKSYIELEKEREKSEWKSEEIEIVNSVDISDGKKEIVKYSTVTYKNMVKWVVGIVIGLVLIPFTDWGMFITVFSIVMCIPILLTILFNGIKTVELRDHTFIFSDEKKEREYKSLEYFILTTYSGDFLAYRDYKGYWLKIPMIAFNSSLMKNFLKNYLMDKLPVSKGNLDSEGEEAFYIRDEEDIKADYRKREVFGKHRVRVHRAMRNGSVPLKRLQQIANNLYESENRIIIKKEALIINGNSYRWEKLQPVKLSKTYGGILEIKTKDEETVFSSRTTAITRVPLFEALYNSMVK